MKFYQAFKILAIVSLLVHVTLHIVTVTDFFNRIFIGISLLVLALPRKWWGLYVLPVLLIIVGLVVGGYAVYLWLFI